MKKRQKQTIGRAICGATAGSFADRGNVLVAIPRGRVLRGVCIEDSSDSSVCYVWAFVQPLYVPAEDVHLTFGHRLGGSSKGWRVEDAEQVANVVVAEGMDFLNQVKTPADVAEWELVRDTNDANAVEARAYSLVASGQAEEAEKALACLASLLGGEGPAWMAERLARCEELRAALRISQARANALLAKWESGTVRALRLGEVP